MEWFYILQNIFEEIIILEWLISPHSCDNDKNKPRQMRLSLHFASKLHYDHKRKYLSSYFLWQGIILHEPILF